MARSAKPTPRQRALLARCEWHDNLATLYAAPMDPTLAATLHDEADEYLNQTEVEFIERSTQMRDRALLTASHAVRTQAKAAENPENHTEFVKHALVSAQLRAVAEGADIDMAIRKKMTELAAHEDEGVRNAVSLHPYNVTLMAEHQAPLPGAERNGNGKFGRHAGK